MAQCAECGGTGRCHECRGTGTRGAEVCTLCKGRGNCFVCTGSVTRTVSGDVRIDVQGEPTDVSRVLSDLLQSSTKPAYADELEEFHPNIRILIKRMDLAMEVKDYSGALHASASIFETLAKEIVSSPDVENKTLASFFSKYRAESRLPEQVLDYIMSVYRARNTTPLAGHGSIGEPEISEETAIVLAEMTKAFLRIEYRTRKYRQLDE